MPLLSRSRPASAGRIARSALPDRPPSTQIVPRTSTLAKLGAGAAVLAAAAVANHLLARDAERRNPPRGRFIEVDGVRLHYLDEGRGPPVVLLHGNGTSSEDFRISGLLDLLARDHRVIAFDRPGYGHSERPGYDLWAAPAQADLLHRALRQLGIQRPVLVGHSWGCLVALYMALNNRLDTGALVLMSGYYVPSLRVDVPLFSPPAIPILGDVLRYTISPLLSWLLIPRLFRKIFAPAPVSQDFMDRFPTEMALRPSQLRASAAETLTMIPGAAGVLNRLGELTMPVYIVAGTGDRIVDTQVQSGHLHDAVPGSHLDLIEGAGHMVHHQLAVRVAETIANASRAADFQPT